MGTCESSKKWILPDEVSREAEKYSVDPLVAQLLIRKGVSPEETASFLYPSLEQIPDYTHLHDAKRAAKKIIEGVNAGKKIYIHGDFDADGICATSILWEFIYREVAQISGKKVDVMPYIPDRVDEGYGLSQSSMERMIDDGAQIVITVDCGVRDGEFVNEIAEKHGIEMIITDHHQPPQEWVFSEQITVVHPMYPEHNYPHTEVCGSFVALLLTQAIRVELGVDWELRKDYPGLDLAAFATVTDMMKLVGPNRALVQFGIFQMQDSKRIGLRKLMDVASIKARDVESYHIGYILGPRINAAGRIGKPIDGVKLFTTKSAKSATQIASSLDELNKRRQELTEQILEEAKEQVDRNAKLIFVSGKNWSEGIVGLVAGKLMEQFNRPTIVVTVNNGEARGSARSFGSFNITHSIEKFSHLLHKYGGHALAAGFGLDAGNVVEFGEQIVKYANEQITDEELQGSLKIDLLLNSDQANLDFLNNLQYLSPFGYGNPTPLIMLPEAVIVEKSVMGKEKNHLKIELKSGGINRVSGVMFNCMDDVEKLQIDDLIDVAGYLDLNRWNGHTSVQFRIKEWRRAVRQ